MSDTLDIVWRTKEYRFLYLGGTEGAGVSIIPTLVFGFVLLVSIMLQDGDNLIGSYTDPELK